MKQSLLYLIVCLFSIPVFSQVNFEHISFEASLKQAKQSGKLIFLQFESSSCNQCNDVAAKAFSNPELSTLLEESFICLYIDRNHPDRDRISNLYNKKAGNFGSLFISWDGNLVHNYGGSSTMIKTYREHVDKALTKAGDGMRLAELQKEYNSGNKRPGLLELLMQTRKSLMQPTDDLLDVYVQLLPSDSLRSIRTMNFIASMAPILETPADLKFREDFSIYEKVVKSLKPQDYVSMVTRIGSKSMTKAIAEKNETYAKKVASFMKSTFPGSTNGGQKIYEEKMISYYYGVADTVTYLAMASKFYDQYLMSIRVSDIKKRDSISLKKLFDKQPPPPAGTANGTVFRQTVGFSPSTQIYNRQLNEAANRFYELTNDPVYLAKALTWSARANEFHGHYTSLQTHALLLSKTGDKPGAIEYMQKAISEKKKQGFDTKSLEKDLEKIEKGKL